MKLTTSALALLLLVAALPAAAQSYDWSNVGSVGIALRGDGHVFTGPTFTFAPFLTGALTARYNVTNTAGGGLDKTPAWTNFHIATTTSGSGSVTARLMQVDKCSNQESNICEVTSSTGTSCSTCTFGSSTFDFANNIYYIQVNISRSSGSDTASLHSVAIN